MKILILIRHAKSSWKDPQLTDRDRPLNKRGRRNAVEMANRHSCQDLDPDLVVSSPARRAIDTATIMQQANALAKKPVAISQELYTFDFKRLLPWLRHLDNGLKTVAIFGHNPAITDLVNYLAATVVGKVPTCGIAVLELGVDHWADLEAGCARLRHFDYPKRPK